MPRATLSHPWIAALSLPLITADLHHPMNRASQCHQFALIIGQRLACVPLLGIVRTFVPRHLGKQCKLHPIVSNMKHNIGVEINKLRLKRRIMLNRQVISDKPEG
jgi:hypothetical protein